MATYNITNVISGADCGDYPGEDEEAALDAWARDAGYSDYAAAREVAAVEPGELRVRAVEAA